MRFIDFSETSASTGKTGRDAASLDGNPGSLRWIDCVRGEDRIPDALESVLHPRHRRDLLNATHAPYVEHTDEYELLIFASLNPHHECFEPRMYTLAFVLYGNSIYSFRDGEDLALDELHQLWSNRDRKFPSDTASLLHALLDEAVNRLLDLRDPLDSKVSEWQRRLLDPDDPFNDWQIIMQARSGLRRLNASLELQQEAVDGWRDNTRFELNARQQIKFNDLREHLGRMERLLQGIRADLESLTQVYFASTGQRTNSNVQFLAVISAIFLPLNLVAGFFGMNFAYIPLLDQPFGVVIVIGLMLMLVLGLLWWFKRKRWY
jgi:magnesium transporter